MANTKKNDFIEIEFTAKDPEGNIFDTNIESDAKKTRLELENIKPLILSVGQEMVIPGLDKELENKEIGKKYSVEILPEQGFGKRNPALVQMVPSRLFREQNISPVRGMPVTLDGRIAKIISVSGGRILVDFNNPLAGKKVTYDFKINRKVSSQDEKINSIQDFLFRKQFPFKIKEKTIFFQLKQDEKKFEKFICLFLKKFEDILGMKAEVEFLDEEKKADENKAKNQEEKKGKEGG